MLKDTRALPTDTTTADRGAKVVSIVALDGRDDSALLALAASLARSLKSRVAAAIVQSARERDIEIRQVEQLHLSTAMGVAAAVAGHSVVLGTAALFGDLGLSVDNLGDWPARLRRRGEQVLLVAIDGRTAGFVGVAETNV